MKIILSVFLLLSAISASFGQERGNSGHDREDFGQERENFGQERENLRQEREDIRQIRFHSFSRGYQKDIIINPDSTIIREEGLKTGKSEVKRATRKAEWNTLLQSLPDHQLEALDQLEAPTMHRASDRAPHSRITIKTEEKAYESAEFDGYKPHKKLEGLVNIIRQIEQRAH